MVQRLLQAPACTARARAFYAPARRVQGRRSAALRAQAAAGSKGRKARRGGEQAADPIASPTAFSPEELAERQRVAKHVARTADEVSGFVRSQNQAAVRAAASGPPDSEGQQMAAVRSTRQTGLKTDEAQRVAQHVARTAADVSGYVRTQRQAAARAARVAAHVAAVAESVDATVQAQARRTRGTGLLRPDRSSAGPSAPPPAAPPSGWGWPPAAEDAPRLKLHLLEMVAGLDRGSAATREQAEAVDAAARQLEAAGGPVELSWGAAQGAAQSTMSLLDGRWRLVYSSAFGGGRGLGGARPGPPAPLPPPLGVGQVYQDIRSEAGRLDNVVELVARISLALLPGVGAQTPTATATLGHAFAVEPPSTLRITYDATSVRLAGGLRGWLGRLPALRAPELPEALRPPVDARSARFDIVFLDRDMRLTRGDRGELRVFVRGSEPA